MRRKAIKLREFPLGGARVNSTHIGTFLETYFVIGDSQNNVRLYTFEGEEEIQIYANHNNQNVQTQVTAVSLSCTENEIFSGSNRGIINVWDMETAKCNVPLRGHSTAVNCFGVYPDEPSKLASGSYDTTIKIWDIRQKNCIATLKGHSKQINSLAVSPDGNLLLSGSEDSTARLWQLRMSDRPIYVANQHNGPIIKVKFNHEDCMFATCSADKTAKYFRCQQKCYGFASSTDMIATPITSIGFSDDGKTLYTAANDVLKSWDMYKNGLHLQSFQTSWKGVQDLTMIKQALMGIAFSNGVLSLWVCDVNQKIKNSSRFSEPSSIVLPKIGTKYSKKQNQFNVNEIQNIVGFAVQKVKDIEDRPVKDVDLKKQQFQKKKQEMQKKKEEMQKKKQEMLRKKQQDEKRQKQLQLQREKIRERQKQRLLLEQLLKQKEQREKKQQERLRKLDEEKRQEERLFRERQEREKAMQLRLKETFQNQNNMDPTMEYDVLENSSLMNISTFVADGNQKEKLRQVELIGDIIKEKSKFQSVLRERSNAIKPIINFWRQGKIGTALELISKSSHIIMGECISTILSTPIFKQGITPQVGITLTSALNDLMKTNKHSTYVTMSMNNINSIVLLFKEQLIKIKTFNPLTRVDLSREQRLAKYDKLIDQFLNVFRQERLKKYYERSKQGESNDLCNAAFQLYKNLEEVLIKIMPKQQPQMA